MPLSYTTDSPSEVVAQVLVDMGLGGATGGTDDWATFASGEPDLPDNCITVYDTQSFLDGRTHDGVLQGQFGIQVRVRSIDHRTGWAKAKYIESQLSLILPPLGRTVARNGRTYLISSFSGFGGVLALGKAQESKRSLFTINMLVNLKQR